MIETPSPAAAPSFIAPPEVPADSPVWIDTAALLGFSGRSKKQDLNVRAWFARPERLAAEVERVVAAYPKAEFLTLQDPLFYTAWKALPKDKRPPLHVVIPNIRSLIREATEYGMVGAGVRKGLRVGVWRMIAFGLSNMLEGPGVLKKDFPTLLRILTRLERAEAVGIGAETIVLQSQMTDLALAMGEARLLEEFVENIRKVGKRPGLMTSNANAVAKLLADPDGEKLIADDNSGRSLAIVAPRLDGGAKFERSSRDVLLARPGASSSSGDAVSLASWPIERELLDRLS